MEAIRDELGGPRLRSSGPATRPHSEISTAWDENIPRALDVCMFAPYSPANGFEAVPKLVTAGMGAGCRRRRIPESIGNPVRLPAARLVRPDRNLAELRNRRPAIISRDLHSTN